MSAPSDDRLRIGDAEREGAQASLSEHYAAGRLDHDEYSERLDRIWAARTGADLAPVFADLPGPEPVRHRGPWEQDAARPWDRPAGRTPGRPPGRPRFPVPLVGLLAVLVLLTVVTHLPVLLIGLAVWFLLFRGGCRSGWRHH